MNWRSMTLWLGSLVVLGLLYGAWMQRTRSLIKAPKTAPPRAQSDEELARYLNDAVGPKAKTPCDACSPAQEKLFMSTLQWVAKVQAQEKGRRR